MSNARSTFAISRSLVLFWGIASCGTFANEVSSVIRQLVRPVLIRNEHNSLLQLTITTNEPFVEVESISVQLVNFNQLESLQFYLTDGDSQMTSEKAFGERLTANEELVFQGHARLSKGINRFWLSCRPQPDAELTAPVDAKVTAVETSLGRIVPIDETPHVQKRIGIALRRHGDDGVHTYRIPALATTPPGTLLAVYDMRRRARKDLQEDIDIGLLRSTDGGRSWGAQRVIMDMKTYGNMPQEVNGCSDPGILVDPATGEVFCFAVWMNGRPGTHQWNAGGSEPGFAIGASAQFMMVRSKDDGQTWSKPQNMTRIWKNPEWILYAPLAAARDCVVRWYTRHADAGA